MKDPNARVARTTPGRARSTALVSKSWHCSLGLADAAETPRVHCSVGGMRVLGLFAGQLTTWLEVKWDSGLKARAAPGVGAAPGPGPGPAVASSKKKRGPCESHCRMSCNALWFWFGLTGPTWPGKK